MREARRLRIPLNSRSIRNFARFESGVRQWPEKKAVAGDRRMDLTAI